MLPSSFFNQYNATPPPSRPHVTLTFAQSIDAKIAAKNRTQLILSGEQSMRMTHGMRTLHDAILIGIDTAINDDPQLNTRLLPQGVDHPNPRPVILDSRLRLPPTSKLLENFNAGKGLQPWIIYRSQSLPEFQSRKAALVHAGAILIELDTSNSIHLPIQAVLQKLRDLGVRSLMVEGGVRVIASFFECHMQSVGGGEGGRDRERGDERESGDGEQGTLQTGIPNLGVIDSVVVTIAPVFVGDDGIGPSFPGSPAFKHVFTEIVGRDSVLGMRADLS